MYHQPLTWVFDHYCDKAKTHREAYTGRLMALLKFNVAIIFPGTIDVRLSV